ncbi:MAG TPA: crosslink repair DNA glycosylase YcaQ family protein [Candidatus Limnocylindria bacterium]|nr:crosslink repair DNA glycosylase YcaQ family protein [Candidatus Limnocylindria bacterium]
MLAVVERLGVLQFDPLEVPGARNHDLVLHARVAGYRREWCDAWLYGPDRRLIELYNKSLNIMPLAELPYYRLTWDRNAPHYDEGILREQSAVVEAIRERIQAEGPLSTAAFGEHNHAVDWWWAPTRAARAVMEAMFVSGRLGIARRDGNRRYYDLIERLVPAELLAERASTEEATLHRLMSRYRATGLTTPSAQAEVMYSAGTAVERRRLTAELVERGQLLPVEVEGVKGTRYIAAGELPFLDDDSPPPPAVTFLAPLDPLMWDRRQLRELWNFDYLWEVYVPEAKRRWGYYVLPILFSERFVGRWEPRVDRKTGTLRVLGLWWEECFAPRAAEEFVPAMRVALRAYMEFTGTRRVEWPSPALGRLFGQPGRQTGVQTATASASATTSAPAPAPSPRR